MRLLKRFRQLSGKERRLCVQALVMLPVMRVSVHLWGFAATHRACRSWASNPVTEGSWDEFADHASLVVRTGRLVHAAARHGGSGATCLPRSLVVWTLLRRQGIDAQIRFGARRRQKQFEAHAWVEAAGLTVDDGASLDAMHRFAPFAPLA